MQIITTDIAVIGAGGAGLRTAIAAAEANPDLEVALISKVYPMRSTRSLQRVAQQQLSRMKIA